MFESIDTRSLTYARSEKLTVFCKNDSVTFRVLDNFICKKHVANLFGSRECIGDGFEFLGSLNFQVSFLNESAVETSADCTFKNVGLFLNEDNTVLFLLENGESVVGIFGSDADFEENLVHCFGCLGVDRAVGYKNTAKSRNRVSGKRRIPGFENSGACSEATGVVVLENCKGCVFKFCNQSCGGIDVKQVVV